MTDRELLERAAQAAGYVLTWKTGHCKGGEFSGAFISEKDDAWNPLTNDGDALRLAVTLNLNVFIGRESTGVNDGEIPTRKFPSAVESHGEDKFAATRRAIVLAAAAMAQEEAK